MYKIHLILLVTLLLLITLSSGCFSPRVEHSITQLENNTSSIKKDLTGLKSSLDDKIRELNANIQKNNSQLEKETSTIKKELAGFESGLSSQIQKLHDGIQKNSGQIKKELTDLKSSLNLQVQKLNMDVQANGSQLKNKISALDDKVQKLNTAVHKTMSKQKPYWIIAVLIFAIAGIFFFLKYKMVRLGNILSSELTSSLEKLKNELIQLDTKPVPVPEQKLENGNLQVAQEAELDHSLPIKVCEEIQRMRNRMKHMDQDDQATKVFSKRLASLEDKLNSMGYEMGNLENTPYREGMTVEARFISNENMNEGEEIITKVIKPQINFNGVLIKAADVEVSQGSKVN